ncbi:cinnamoyl-CoA reductase-like SNL6 [Wolffia australiana]
MATKRVCVMDAGGRVGAALVKKLLSRGYVVNAASQGDGRALVEILGEEERERVEFFRTDPFDYHSLCDAVKGCSGLFYSFEPLPELPSYDEEMAEVEAMAAQNVLEACAQTETMERVVYTSSVTAVVWRESRRLVAGLDEHDWSDPIFCRKFRLWHALSKTLAEKAAWALAMDRGISMVAINAGLLGGPGLSIANPYLKGAAEMYEEGMLVTVEEDFLADAHLCAFEDPAAYGRYLCFNRVVCRPDDATDLAKTMGAPSAAPSPSQDLKCVAQRIRGEKLSKLMLGFGGLETGTVH